MCRRQRLGISACIDDGVNRLHQVPELLYSHIAVYIWKLEGRISYQPARHRKLPLTIRYPLLPILQWPGRLKLAHVAHTLQDIPDLLQVLLVYCIDGSAVEPPCELGLGLDDLLLKRFGLLGHHIGLQLDLLLSKGLLDITF